MRTLKKLIVIVHLLLFSFTSAAALIEASWPPPGSPDFSGSGISAVHTGGSTWVFSNFKTSEYDELFFGIKNIGLGEDARGSYDSTAMVFNASLSDLSNGLVVWTNTFDFFNAQSSSVQTVAGLFMLTINDLANNPLNLTLATDLGLDNNLGGLLNITGDFTANMAFQIEGNPAISWYDNAHNSPDNWLVSTFESAWYYSPPTSVSEPPAIFLGVMVLLLLAGQSTRKKLSHNN